MASTGGDVDYVIIVQQVCSAPFCSHLRFKAFIGRIAKSSGVQQLK